MPAALAIDSADLPAGSRVAGRYEVISVLGRGGMGTVFLAEHLSIGRKVALKVLSGAWVLHDEVRQRFVAEARATARIGHPGIVDVIDAGNLADGRPFLAMEYLDGVSLTAAVRSAGRFTLERTLAVARGIADALVAAHAVGIVHRDLKCDNVMLVGERTKLLDFGIAAALRDAPSARMTIPGLVMGTPAYMPPEQGRGAPATPSFDVYALGAVMFEMLCGVTPFEGDDPLAVLVAKASSPAPSLAGKRSDLPHGLVELVDACLAAAPSSRPADMVEVRSRIDALAGPRATLLRRHRRGGRHLPTMGATLVAALSWGAVTVADTGPPPVAALRLAAAMDPEEVPAGILVVPHQPLAASPAAETPSTAPSPAQPIPRARTSRPRSSAVDSRECERTRRQALEARQAHDWNGVLRHVEHAACWDRAIEPKLLRVKATFELERFSECIMLGEGGGDPRVRKLVDLCRRRLLAR